VPGVSIHPDFVEDGRKLLRRHPEWAKRVRKALDQLATDSRHPGLRTKRYADDVWQSYVANNTPGAWRIWWMHDPTIEDAIIVIGFGPHPVASDSNAVEQIIDSHRFGVGDCASSREHLSDTLRMLSEI
jgi:hypothetical protein